MEGDYAVHEAFFTDDNVICFNAVEDMRYNHESVRQYFAAFYIKAAKLYKLNGRHCQSLVAEPFNLCGRNLCHMHAIY